MEVGVNPSISVAKVSGSGAKNNIPVVRSYEKAGKARSRRLCFAQEVERSTCLQAQKHRVACYLVDENCQVTGRRQVIKGQQVGASKFHFL